MSVHRNDSSALHGQAWVSPILMSGYVRALMVAWIIEDGSMFIAHQNVCYASTFVTEMRVHMYRYLYLSSLRLPSPFLCLPPPPPPPPFQVPLGLSDALASLLVTTYCEWWQLTQ